MLKLDHFLMIDMCYSFDVFDTCLIRTCGYPHNVFDILALRILGLDSDDSMRADFVNTRIKAEKQVRRKKQSEITLEEIYDECNFNALTQSSVVDIAKEEINIEREILVAALSIQKQISELHSQGISVFYISDMYFSEEFIKELLIKNNFWQDGDRLYVSSTSGKTKYQGSLYELIAQENGICYNKWNHYGDNYYSDYIVPRKKGIKAHLVSHEFSRYEKHLLDLCLFPDIFINQQLAGIQKAIRISLGSTPQIDLACNIVIPLITAFVFNVLETARKDGINQLFFLARDGYLPYYIACLLQKYYPEIRLEYFYTSRSALYFPGIDSPDKNNLLQLFGRLTGKKLNEVFIDRTNIDISDFLSELEINRIIQCETQGITMVTELYNNEKFVETIEYEYQKQRELVLEYFIQSGIASTECKGAVIDIRGSRACHGVINGILKEYAYLPVRGFYLEVIEDRKGIADAGSYYAEFYSERYINGSKSFRSMGGLYSVIEQYFCVTGSFRTIKYKKEGTQVLPIFEEGSASEYGKKMCDIHEMIADKYVKFYMDNFLSLFNKELSLFINYNTFLFAQLPYKYDLRALTNIVVNDDRFHYVKLIKKYSIVEILKRKFGLYEWSRGSLAYTVYSWVGESIGRILLTYIFKRSV